MPNRILKESICASESLEQLNDATCEVLFFRLIVNCDDFGRFDGRAAVVRSSCYKLSSNGISLTEVEDRLQRLAAADLIRFYVAGGRRYLYLPTWEQHQSRRAKKSKWPDPPARTNRRAQTPPPDNAREQVLADANNCKQLSADVPVFENGNGNVNEERESRSKHMVDADASTDPTCGSAKPPRPHEVYSADFLSFWNSYPKKVEKRGAYRCWRARLKERLESGEPITSAMLLAAGRTYAARCVALRTEPEFIKHPSTFLNRDHAFTEHLAPQTEKAPKLDPKQTEAELERWMRSRNLEVPPA